jgi:hypothetical protein
MPGIQNWRSQTEEDCVKIEKGDWVRSYDFEFLDDCYVLGRVIAIGEMLGGCPRYEIQPFRRVSEGRESLKGSINRDNVFPPVNGTRHIFGGFCNGVRKCEGEELEYWREKWADWASDVDFD